MSKALQLRSLPVGGEPRPPPEEQVLALLNARRVLFLVHGYNNDEPTARAAFAGFESLQRELAGVPQGRDYALGWDVVHVYWAGDADWSIASPLFYMGAVGNARKTGALLAQVIGGLGRLDEIAFVAHSLGCRVVLETLLAMRSARCGARVSRVAFFAAAVPTFKLEQGEGGSLGWAAQGIGEEWLSLFSEHDRVLSGTFPLGQTLAGVDEGPLPCALGFTLWAAASTSAVLSQAENRGAGHSDYWGWREKTRARNGRFAAQLARTMLRLEPAALQRPIDERATVVRALEAREIAAREQEARQFQHYSGL